MRSIIEDLASQILCSVDHGECFYDTEMLDEFIADLDRMKNLAIAYYRENKDEKEDE
ncbi:hypothetical protein ACPJHH_13190 [Bacillus altitudinis]|uniref:hypothetical protein n=1 Tax=Bacillus altitudinis TaxID=293387 RepID=UPI003D098B45